jgi:hypothetical protein
MTFNEAMQIVSEYGYANKCNSLIDTISEMEDNIFELTNFQRMAMEVVIGEYDTIADYT